MNVILLILLVRKIEIALCTVTDINKEDAATENNEIIEYALDDDTQEIEDIQHNVRIKQSDIETGGSRLKTLDEDSNVELFHKILDEIPRLDVYDEYYNYENEIIEAQRRTFEEAGARFTPLFDMWRSDKMMSSENNEDL